MKAAVQQDKVGTDRLCWWQLILVSHKVTHSLSFGPCFSNSSILYEVLCHRLIPSSRLNAYLSHMLVLSVISRLKTFDVIVNPFLRTVTRVNGAFLFIRIIFVNDLVLLFDQH